MDKYYNITERLIINKLDEIWNTLNNCKCDRCRNDIIALTLNQVGSKYVVSSEGELYSKLCTLSQDYEFEVVKAIAKATFIVNEKPNH